MKKYRDYINILILIVSYFIILLVTTKCFNYLPLSKVDFDVQHYPLAEYFRNLFYETKDIFPDFSFNLGAGENIYYISYYGLLNPIIMFSYLMPHVPMIYYIMIMMSLIVIISTVLFYYYLRRNNYSLMVSFISSFIFLTASPIIFHSHRHIMFIDYFPFLIMSFYGIDSFVKNNKSTLLVISLALIILTSYYYSPSVIAVIFIYSIYKYLSVNGTNELYKFIKKTIFRIIISVLITMVLILPTAYTILNGRSGSGNTVDVLSLLIPKLDLYTSYSIGFTLTTFIILVFSLFSKDKYNKLLGFILVSIIIFPIFNYILNGTLYINAKSLIPFIPLCLIVISNELSILFKNKFLKYLLFILIIITSTTTCIMCNLNDKLMRFSDFKNIDYKIHDDIYRTNTSNISKEHINKVNNIDEFKTTMYSSTFNNDYRNFYLNVMENPMNYRNKFMITSSSNIIREIYMGEKYIYSNFDLGYPYKKIGNDLFELDSVLPIIYSTEKTISKIDYESLNYPDNIINLIGKTISNKTNTNIINVNKINNYIILESNGLVIEKTTSGYIVNADKSNYLKVKVNDNLDNKLLFVDFDILKNNSCKTTGDLNVRINNIDNKLTCREWKYNNENHKFSYVISSTVDNTLDIHFTKGIHEISNINLYVLDYDLIKNIKDNVQEFKFDKAKTKGDIIEGSINVINSSVIVTSIPYDKGFNVYIDGIKTKYKKVNECFIGFDISSGYHNIKIEYKAPYKNISLVISLIGIILLIYNYIKEKS
ncbi:MAG: YfhO family protein [Bacilli bacterium]|nr:YfhO family protein [Bacilli bacterium]